jgi:hypothetical protein
MLQEDVDELQAAEIRGVNVAAAACPGRTLETPRHCLRFSIAGLAA